MEANKRVQKGILIKWSLAKELRFTGSTIKNRVKSRLCSHILCTSCQAKSIAYRKSSIIITTFLCNTSLRSKTVLLDFIYKIKDMQQVWKRRVQLNLIRKGILRKKWDEMIQKLIKREKMNAKPREYLVLKLQGLGNDTIRKAINEYFSTQKRKYCKSMSKIILARREKEKENEANGIENEDLNSKPYPLFKYLPVESTLSKMIIELATGKQKK